MLPFILAAVLQAAPNDAERVAPPGGDELKRLVPHLTSTCAIVRENPSMWPFRIFPYGPLGLEVRKASPGDADRIRNFHLGLAAAACDVPPAGVTGSFFCGPECPRNRRDHLVSQLPRVRAAVDAFERLRPIDLISIWAPKGELRVNDVFVLDGETRQALPSARLGLVPSGEWKAWVSLETYLATIKVNGSEVTDLVQQMLGIGVSALVREISQVRLVAVGVGDNESGMLFLGPQASPPVLGGDGGNGREYVIVEEVAPGVWFYETS